MSHKQCEHIIPTETRGTYVHLCGSEITSSTENRGIRIQLQQVSTLKIKCVAYTFMVRVQELTCSCSYIYS